MRTKGSKRKTAANSVAIPRSSSRTRSPTSTSKSPRSIGSPKSATTSRNGVKCQKNGESSVIGRTSYGYESYHRSSRLPGRVAMSPTDSPATR
jgi:hypothetical protein